MTGTLIILGLICSTLYIPTVIVGVLKGRKLDLDSEGIERAIRWYRAAVGFAVVGLLAEPFDGDSQWWTAADAAIVALAVGSLWIMHSRLASRRAHEMVMAEHAAKVHNLPWVGDPL